MTPIAGAHFPKHRRKTESGEFYTMGGWAHGGCDEILKPNTVGEDYQFVIYHEFSIKQSSAISVGIKT